jgi:NAD(P)-dependent dehydrogenase (short-subunit alcohol dehydrogenase family)
MSRTLVSDLEGRRILVTGAASGIGAATAKRCVALGARVALVDRDVDRLRSTADECGAPWFELDVADADRVPSVVDAAADALGGLDGVVNAAGVSTIAPFAETDLALMQFALDVNLIGPFLVCQAALPHLKAGSSSTIVTVSSAAALQPLANRAAYSASKSAVLAMSKVMAMELAPDVRVNVVTPGAIDTPMVRGSFSGEALARVTARYALGRLGTPDEVAAAIVFLTSSESSFMTGATLSVDGGRTYY